MRKKLFIPLAAIIAIFVIGFVSLIVVGKKGQDKLTYESVNMMQVKDGTYQGEGDAGVVCVKVKITVADHKLIKVSILEHRNGLGSKGEKIVDQMYAENNYDVDTISGATVSSNAIKSAVSKALMM